MNQHLQKILDIVEQKDDISDEDKESLIFSIKAADKEFEITAFKLDRTEKVKRTTAILLEETIEELEQKRKAVEEQNRELEIESALERVRSVAMGMKKPEDVLNICKIIYAQLSSLGISEHRNVIANFWDDERKTLMDYDYSDSTGANHSELAYSNHPAFVHFQQTIKNSKDSFVELHIAGDDLETWKKRRIEDGEYEDPRLDNISELYYYFYSIGVGALGISTFSPLLPEQLALLKRLRNVFDFSHSRYREIEKAEAQAREAQIEAALERIRTSTMAMHKSGELLQTSQVLFDQFKQLGQHADQLTIGIMNEKDGVVEIYATLHGEQLPTVFRHPISEPYVMNKVFKGWKARKTSLTLQMSAKELEAYNQFRNELVGTEIFARHVSPHQKRVIYCSYFSQGMLAFGDHEQPTVETSSILDRFAKVFEQTYTRFLDLQKAEEQAKEAQIEAALERVRSRSLAMHHSSELSAVVDTLLREFTNLEFTLTFCIINLIDEQNRSNTVWAANPEAGKHPESYNMKFEDYPFHHAMWNAWKEQKKNFTYTIEGEEKKIYDEYLYTKTEFRRFPKHVQEANKALKRYVAGFTFFKYSGLQTVSENQISDDELNILERFGRVFEQSYTRFLDLQKAEAQAKEAEIELALERVRSQAMAMNKSSDLLDIVVTMRNEFTRLGHEAHYFWHMMWLPDKYEKAMTSGDGTRIGMVMELPRHIHGDIELLNRWEQSEEPLVVYPMDVDAAIDYIDKMVMLGNFKQVDPHAPTHDDIRHINGLTFIMARTTHGEIGYSLPGVVPDPPQDDQEILIRFAGAFDIAHRRFLDLQQSEAQALQIRQEKERLELTLANLRATQSQLIQSEKMASLGELTAGIAHEIQNPLNFVNNFSEVSTELLEELKDEIENKNFDDVKIIADDVKNNLTKILHHGKRADAIVKGMLQHSRSNSGQKEPTDINALADEYLRLAYHGLRAKDNSFNATLLTDYDNSIGNISIVPQDIGRVILNLITNAFYAVNEKFQNTKTSGNNAYEPTVTVTTKKSAGTVQVIIKDNGDGIPQKVLDKIFQPFFTTKPAGEGTGLGLSLSYDIVKAHGGELKVETQEGEGSEFIIQIPFSVY